MAAALRQGLDEIATPKSSIAGLKVKGAVWAQPRLLATVEYRAWTAGGELRHASFKGLAGQWP